MKRLQAGWPFLLGSLSFFVAASLLFFLPPSLGAQDDPATAHASACPLAGFTAAEPENAIVRLAEPIAAAKVKGTIGSEDGYAIPGDALFEIRPYGQPKALVQRAQADLEGKFRIKGVRPGRYCFKVTANGWQSVVGELVVEENPGNKAEIEIKMRLGV